MKSESLNVASFEAAVGAMPDDRLAALRHEAGRRFGDRGFPTTRDEDWKYTSLARATELTNQWLERRAAPARPAVDPGIVSEVDAYWIPLRNGTVDVDRLALPTGIRVRSLTGEPDLQSTTLFADNPMSQFNLALLRDGIRIDVAAGTTVDKPIGLLFQDAADEADTVSQYRVVINAGESARAEFVEFHVSSGAKAHYANGVIEIALERQAEIGLLRLQRRSRHHLQSGQTVATLGPSATLRHSAFDLGGALIRNDLSVVLEGTDASVDMNGLYLVGDRQHVDNHTRVDHRVGPTRSNELYRGILNRRAHAVFNGKAVVHDGADGTDARQANNNLLLSDHAEIDTKPELEIYADDVKCSHGATVGQLDATALFYLRTRGIDEATAKALLTRAFAAEILSLNPVAAASEYLASAVEQRLDTLIGDDLHE